jgi:hypothetical protein
MHLTDHSIPMILINKYFSPLISQEQVTDEEEDFSTSSEYQDTQSPQIIANSSIFRGSHHQTTTQQSPP